MRFLRAIFSATKLLLAFSCGQWVFDRDVSTCGIVSVQCTVKTYAFGKCSECKRSNLLLYTTNSDNYLRTDSTMEACAQQWVRI